MPKSRLHQLATFIRVFGVSEGLRLWFSLHVQLSSSAQMLALKLPNLAAPVNLRRADLPIFWQILIMQENDFHELPQARRVKENYQRIIAEGGRPTIVDCGGHIGLSAIFFATRFPEAIVYTVEPDTANLNLLRQNTGAYDNVVPLHGGVWSHSCSLEISNPNSGSASFVLQETAPTNGAGGAKLTAYTIDEVLHRDENNRLFLVKVDIEGAESSLFEGPTVWPDAATVLIIELHDWLMPWKGTSRNFFKRLAESEFDVVIRGENLLLFRA